MTQKIKVIIPAYNEEDSIAKVINDIPTIVDEIIVISNNSTDKTEENAANAGATVLKESKRGYGYACLKGMDYIASTSLSDQEKKTTIVVFLDGDYSDYPEQLTELVAPIINDNIDLVIGSRVKELRETGSMTPQQVFGNWLATFLMNIFFGAKFTDLGPFRAIKYQKLLQLKMEDKTYGWTVEMQLKAIKQHFSYIEVPMKYRNRIGISKVSGTLKGSILAGVKILGWIFKYSFK
ncbi:MAG: glycosyltransferase family 2 protein [Flavobacterium sp.]|jgi:glycosyltransferase involved in cell wall biosynthesis|nr:glycosyltransferase family 2 protein [Flavobacterium sp.]